MQLGLALSLASSGLPVGMPALGPWTPGEGLASGALLGWWEPSIDTAFVNPDGTGTPAQGDLVGHLSDRSGNGNHLTWHPNSTRRPAFNAPPDGLPGGLRFDGTSDLYQLDQAASYTPSTRSLTIVAAGDFALPSDRQYIMAGSILGYHNDDLLLLAMSNNNRRMGLYDGSQWLDFETTQAPGGTQVVTFVLDVDGDAAGYRNGAFVGSTPWSPNTLKLPVQVMGREDANNFTKGDLHFLALYDGILSDEDRAQVEAYAQATLPRRLAFTNPVQVGTDVHASQGVAIDPRGYIFTSAEGVSSGEKNKIINTYVWDGTSVGAPLHAFNAVDALNANMAQVNGLYFDSETNRLYSGANNWTSSPAAGLIVEYDVAANGAVSYVAEHDVGPHYCEGCAKHGGYWWVIYHDLHEIHQYDLSWGFVAAHALPAPDPGDSSSAGNYYQGIAWRDGIAYVNVHGANDNSPRMLAYHWTGTSFVYAAEMTPPPNATQGFVFDGPDHMVMAVRTKSSAAAPNHVLRVALERL